jgi:hypothetical protein
MIRAAIRFLRRRPRSAPTDIARLPLKERRAAYNSMVLSEEPLRDRCTCGKPGHVEVGAVDGWAYKTISCSDCRGATSWYNGQPRWDHAESCPLGMTDGWGSKIDQEPDRFYCPHREHA